MEYFGYYEDKESWENWEQYEKECEKEILQKLEDK